MRHERVVIASDGAGAVADAYTRTFSGLLRGIYLDLGTLASGAVDFVITEEETGAAILSITNAAASGWYVPEAPVYGTGGSAALYAAGGSAVTRPVPVDGRLKIVTTGAGNSKSGALTIYVGG